MYKYTAVIQILIQKYMTADDRIWFNCNWSYNMQFYCIWTVLEHIFQIFYAYIAVQQADSDVTTAAWDRMVTDLMVSKFTLQSWYAAWYTLSYTLAGDF
jgi:hypothetical protein